MVKRLNNNVPGRPEPAAQIILDRDAELVAGLGETQKRIPAITADIAPRPGADVPPGDITLVSFSEAGCPAGQQLGLVGVPSCRMTKLVRRRKIRSNYMCDATAGASLA